jgi:transposase
MSPDRRRSWTDPSHFEVPPRKLDLLISCDRGGDYAAAASLGAPPAEQIADRFHLLKNAGEHKARALWREIRVQGYPATDVQVRRLVNAWQAHRSTSTRQVQMTPRRTTLTGTDACR